MVVFYYCRANQTMIEPTELRLDEDYELYYINWCRTVLNAFVPFLLLAFLNGRIIYQLKVSTNLSATRVSSGTYSIPRLYKITLSECLQTKTKAANNPFSSLLH